MPVLDPLAKLLDGSWELLKAHITICDREGHTRIVTEALCAHCRDRYRAECRRILEEVKK